MPPLSSSSLSPCLPTYLPTSPLRLPALADEVLNPHSVASRASSPSLSDRSARSLSSDTCLTVPKYLRAKKQLQTCSPSAHHTHSLLILY
eukprot:3886261-Pleurochrysis_carterae.AAC.1